MAALDQTLKGQRPPRRRTKGELLRIHASHLRRQCLSQVHDRPVKQPVLGDAYPASTQSIKNLEIMPLAKLRIETRHTGRGIIVKAITAPYTGAAAVSVVEDERGDVDKVAIYNHSHACLLCRIPEGCILAVKEPYYKCNGEKHDYMICIDHPSDVVLLKPRGPIIPAALRVGVDKVRLKSLEEWRSTGDQAFLVHDLPTAIFCYTEALEAASSEGDPIKAGICGKRAGSNLTLGRYDTAGDDALASRTRGPSKWKSYATAGRAAYELRDYGCYNFLKMFETISPQQVHLDHASYVARTYVAESPLHGRGVFASQLIKAEELIPCEKAASMPNQYDPPKASAALFATMVRQLYDNPSLGKSVLELHGGDCPRSGKEGEIIDCIPVVDVYLIESIRLRNCFSSPLSTREDTRPGNEPGNMAKGLWTYASYMNHACVANAMRSFIGDMLILRATRDIAKDDEIFQQYVPVKAHLALRQTQFRQGWGFECRCTLCEGQARSNPESLDKRTQLLKQIEKIAHKRPPSGAKGVASDAAIRTIGRRNHHSKVIIFAMQLPRNFGFFLETDGPNGCDPRDMFKQNDAGFLMTIHIVSAMKHAAGAYRAMGQPELAMQCEAAGKMGYTMITGFENELRLLS
ncbi:SET domain-containing protein [Pleurostoma richardsiae]|uniref:SET domain-containing protein n=1 Tax=Pleurostoma richardsiae TaxID=41990 RepID=A0AA38RYI9_9PEZI|nr:SET domain-containing protein [Pleurostoma richardsiae]